MGEIQRTVAIATTLTMNGGLVMLHRIMLTVVGASYRLSVNVKHGKTRRQMDALIVGMSNNPDLAGSADRLQFAPFPKYNNNTIFHFPNIYSYTRPCLE